MIDFMPKLISISNVYAAFFTRRSFCRRLRSSVAWGLAFDKNYDTSHIWSQFWGRQKMSRVWGRAGQLSFNCQKRIIIRRTRNVQWTDVGAPRAADSDDDKEEIKKLIGFLALVHCPRNLEYQQLKRNRNNVNQEPWNRIERENKRDPIPAIPTVPPQKTEEKNRNRNKQKQINKF